MIKSLSVFLAYIIVGLLFVVFYPFYLVFMVMRMVSSSVETSLKFIIDKLSEALQEVKNS